MMRLVLIANTSPWLLLVDLHGVEALLADEAPPVLVAHLPVVIVITYIYIYMYIHICIYVYIHIHSYIYIYM